MKPEHHFPPISLATVLFLAAAVLYGCAAIRFFGGNASDGIGWMGLGGLLLLAGGVMLQKIKPE